VQNGKSCWAISRGNAHATAPQRRGLRAATDFGMRICATAAKFQTRRQGLAAISTLRLPPRASRASTARCTLPRGSARDRRSGCGVLILMRDLLPGHRKRRAVEPPAPARERGAVVEKPTLDFSLSPSRRAAAALSGCAHIVLANRACRSVEQPNRNTHRTARTRGPRHAESAPICQQPHRANAAENEVSTAPVKAKAEASRNRVQ